jgi:membrane-bound transcription factor site-1 protease
MTRWGEGRLRAFECLDSLMAGLLHHHCTVLPYLSPHLSMHSLKTVLQVSYTSWFLDAFNYAMATKMNIVNLSIGGWGG